MKKLILAFVAVMTMTAAQAQGDNNQGNGERPRVDRTEMLKRRTDDAVKKYGLNEEQAAKLLQLNTKYADTMGRRMGGQRGGRRGGARPAPNFGGGDNGGGMGQRPEMTDEMRAQMEKMRKEREESQKKYDEELQTIMTPDQYKAYKADQEEMRRNFGNRRGGGGPRGQRN